MSWFLVIKNPEKFPSELSWDIPASLFQPGSSVGPCFGSVYLNTPAACGFATHFTQYKILRFLVGFFPLFSFFFNFFFYFQKQCFYLLPVFYAFLFGESESIHYFIFGDE